MLIEDATKLNVEFRLFGENGIVRRINAIAVFLKNAINRCKLPLAVRTIFHGQLFELGILLGQLIASLQQRIKHAERSFQFLLLLFYFYFERINSSNLSVIEQYGLHLQ